MHFFNFGICQSLVDQWQGPLIALFPPKSFYSMSFVDIRAPRWSILHDGSYRPLGGCAFNRGWG
jgi:hypothetical protein